MQTSTGNTGSPGSPDAATDNQATEGRRDGIDHGPVTGTGRHNDHPVTVGSLSPARSQELLEAGEVGRVGWSAAHGPQIFPVSYAWYDDLIVFRTSPYGILSELGRRTQVVFEVDDLDERSHTGWSVLARGYATGIASPAQLARLWTVDGAEPWAGGIRNVFIGISVTQLTGRFFEPARHARLTTEPPAHG
ncbi:pyridoxamine 5'-phosphate oxidase family protein [Humibacillus sp. DSM 29435]|uniref:pyridoxamine 5'-phosphate oxidase family protein n=1 Tax=Humibacillus sp. DSM 29435 TaxID=1869167 RepID=UPI000A60B1F0|nr:pyridoxamine 5'-phosphate oxidase family protein [Humibacillus sp. DSM 29435]